MEKFDLARISTASTYKPPNNPTDFTVGIDGSSYIIWIEIDREPPFLTEYCFIWKETRIYIFCETETAKFDGKFHNTASVKKVHISGHLSRVDCDQLFEDCRSAYITYQNGNTHPTIRMNTEEDLRFPESIRDTIVSSLEN